MPLGKACIHFFYHPPAMGEIEEQTRLSIFCWAVSWQRGQQPCSCNSLNIISVKLYQPLPFLKTMLVACVGETCCMGNCWYSVQHCQAYNLMAFQELNTCHQTVFSILKEFVQISNNLKNIQDCSCEWKPNDKKLVCLNVNLILQSVGILETIQLCANYWYWIGILETI